MVFSFMLELSSLFFPHSFRERFVSLSFFLLLFLRPFSYVYSLFVFPFFPLFFSVPFFICLFLECFLLFVFPLFHLSKLLASRVRNWRWSATTIARPTQNSQKLYWMYVSLLAFLVCFFFQLYVRVLFVSSRRK